MQQSSGALQLPPVGLQQVPVSLHIPSQHGLLASQASPGPWHGGAVVVVVVVG
jgi:hypothetical protein